MKIDSPDCGICCAGLKFWDGNWDLADVVTAQGSLPLTTTGVSFDSTDIPAVGANSVICGIDVERDRLLIQRGDNGAVYIYRLNGTTELLWDDTTDAANYVLEFVRYHHSWGYASAMTRSGAEIMLLNSAGALVRGPYAQASNFPTGEGGTPRGFWLPQDFHCDSAGNLYAATDSMMFALGDFRTYIVDNDDINIGSETPSLPLANFYYERTSATASGYFGFFHDGSDVYTLQGGISDPLAASQLFYYRTPAGTDTETDAVDAYSIFGAVSSVEVPFFASGIQLYPAHTYDALRSRVWTGLWIFSLADLWGAHLGLTGGGGSYAAFCVALID